jgi:hypothetical protein
MDVHAASPCARRAALLQRTGGADGCRVVHGSP